MKIERVWYQLDWTKFRKGHSFFVPCIDVEEARQEVLRVTSRLDVDVLMKVVVEDGIKGLRVWRM